MSMQSYHYILIIISFFELQSLQSSPIEFLYPVAYNPVQNAVYLMYQKSPESLELWFWNPQTKQASPGLLSRFTPAGIRILPSGKAFSFIDHGVIKVQSLLKRSPQRIELDQPLYDITLLQWINDDICYLSAKERAHYGIYQINREGHVSTLVKNTHADCLYPQKVDTSLFYIERLYDHNIQQYRIMQVEYKVAEVPVDADLQEFSILDIESVKNELLPSPICICVLDVPAAFLHMISDDCGYFISYSSKVMRTDSTIACDYYQLKKEKTGNWMILRLFSFCLPTNLLFPHKDTRLYETILSLLPKQYGSQIYYNDICSESGNLSIWSYDVVAGKRSKFLSSSVVGQDYFVPLLIGNTLYIGGRLLVGFVSDSTNDNDNIGYNNVNPLYMESIDNGVEVGLPSIQFPIS